MIHVTRFHVALAASAVLLVACGGGRRDEGDAASVKEDAPLAGRDCRRAEGDSAQAACTALNEIERRSGYRSIVSAFQRRGDTICVETLPQVQNMVDGGGAVEIVRGRLATAVLVDSGGCRKF
jgi:hypothetical protein